MEKGKNGKIAALLIAAVVCCLALFHHGNDWSAVGIYSGCPLAGRLLFHVFHANAIHAMLNAWCLLSVVFIYDVSIYRLLLAYIVASTFPADTLSAVFSNLEIPTVGLSGMVFFLFGSISFEVARKRYYQAWMLFFLAIGFLSPYTNAWMHLYCYTLGVVVALLNRPFKITRHE